MKDVLELPDPDNPIVVYNAGRTNPTDPSSSLEGSFGRVDYLLFYLPKSGVLLNGCLSSFREKEEPVGTDRQEALLATLEADGIRFAWRHIANSDAVNNFPRAFRPPYNAVRTGINMHGSFDTEGRRSLSLVPVLALKTRLAAVRRLAAGSSIGYGCTYRLPREMLVGTVSAGYADGLPLALSNRGTLLVAGVPCPVLGRVSMDYTTLSLETVPDARCGDEVVCLGGQGPAAVSVEDWAQLKGTHSYDIICSFGSRVEHRFIAPV